MSGQHPEPNPVEEVRLHPKADALWRTGLVWLASDRALARYIGRPVASFLRAEAAGGIILLVAALVALARANSSWAASYEALWSTQVGITGGLRPRRGSGALGRRRPDGDLLLRGRLEIKYELVSGELREPRTAVLPGRVLVDESKVGVLLASLVAAGVAAVLLTVDAQTRVRRTADVSADSTGSGN
jgi:Na+/H+ antiporter 1